MPGNPGLPSMPIILAQKSDTHTHEHAKEKAKQQLIYMFSR